MVNRPGEFEIIETYFAPLSKEPGAFGLKDDAALIAVEPGEDLIVSTDTIIAGVHFLPADPPDLVATKLLAVNLSDLAAMAAEPMAYMLAAAWSDETDASWLGRFADGLKQAQETYGVSLYGGDTVATIGPTTLTLTAIGVVGKGRELRRNGANAGDGLYVSGTIGDAALGLMCLRHGINGLAELTAEFLIERYRRPQARVALARELSGLATAAIDVSDGLIADLEKLTAASGTSALVAVSKVPLSKAAQAAVDRSAELIEVVLTGGDDYELLFTAPASRETNIRDLAAHVALPLTRIGDINEYRGNDRSVRVVDNAGLEISLPQSGYRHF